MERIILILVGRGAPPILKQLEQHKVNPKGDMKAIQDDLDALQRMADRKIMSKSKIEDGIGRVIRHMTIILGVRCVLRRMMNEEDDDDDELH